MDIDIAACVISSIISVVVGAVCHSIGTTWGKKERLSIWSLLKNTKELSIALTSREKPSATSSKRVTYIEVLSLTDILPVLEKLNVKYNMVDDNDDYHIGKIENLLCIGGEKANSVTGNLWRLYSNYLPIKLELEPTALIVGDRRYETEYDDPVKKEKIIRDYGIVLVVCTKDNDGMDVCQTAFWGLRGYGTRGAVRSMFNPKLIEHFKRHKKTKSFIAVIRSEGDINDITTTVEEFFPLDKFL